MDEGVETRLLTTYIYIYIHTHTIYTVDLVATCVTRAVFELKHSRGRLVQ